MTDRPQSFRIERLDRQDRSDFGCGVDALDRYLRQQAVQDICRHMATCFVALDHADRVQGYYTLAATGIVPTDLPEETVRKLPRYPLLPAFRLGRLAVDLRARGLGLGGALLADALGRCLRSEVAGFALLVDAKDDEAVAFYRHHGFIPLDRPDRTLFLPLATARAIAGP